jgi:RNA recognition motif-containing protein
MNIYVGNLPYSITEESLRSLFEQFGAVESTKVIVDQISGRSKGFAFVDMPDEEQGNEAIEKLNGYELEGRTIVVNKAKPRAPRESRPRTGGFQSRGPRRF